MNVTNNQLSNSVQRQAAWDHAREVITIPAFRGLYHMVTNCSVIERILMDYEGKQEKRDDGTFFLVDHMEITALSDYWILGFFEIMRIIKSSYYRILSEFPFDKDLKKVHEEANQVRTAFAKLQIPGQSSNIIPSHSSVGPKGTTYVVYDGKGQDVHIRRRELADQFLSVIGKYKKSRQYDEWIKLMISMKGSYDSKVDGPTDLQVYTWRIEGLLDNREYWGLDASDEDVLTESKDREFRDSLLVAEKNKPSGDRDWDAERLAKEFYQSA